VVGVSLRLRKASKTTNARMEAVKTFLAIDTSDSVYPRPQALTDLAFQSWLGR